MRLSPDGSKFATASGDKSIAIFNAEDGSLLKHIKGAHAMSVVDLPWTDNEHFFTCSSDNNVKKWNCNEDNHIKEMTQNDAKRDPSRQLVAVLSEGDSIHAINLKGDICRWNAEGAFEVSSRHQTYFYGIAPHKDEVWYTSENSVFKMTADKRTERVECSHKNKADVVTANSWAVFTQDSDKVMIRFEEGKEAQKQVLPFKAAVICSNESHVFALGHQPDLMIVDAKNLSVLK